jgi:hypothetical protein
MTDAGACGCQRTDAGGWAELLVPAGAEVHVRLAGDGKVPVHNFYTPQYSSVQWRHYMFPTHLLQAYFPVEIDLETRGGVSVIIEPVDGASLEGSQVEVLDASGAPVDDAAGPIYASLDGVTDLEATASLGLTVAALWANLPAGRHFVRATSAAGNNIYESCSPSRPGTGWQRDLDGEVVLEVEVFPGAGSSTLRYECSP